MPVNKACLVFLSFSSLSGFLSFSQHLSVSLIIIFILLVLLHFLFSRCPAFRRLREESDKRKRPSWNELKGSKTEDESDTKTNPAHPRTNNARGPPEPGMVNPAFDESEDGKAFLLFFPKTKTKICVTDFFYILNII